jgi:1-acyl-sn-glycerol-3-phosphate acyltransferase
MASRSPARVVPAGDVCGRPIDVQAPATSIRRYRAIRAFFRVTTRLYSRVRVEGLERLPAGPAILCFTHQNWADPFYVLAASPPSPRVYFFGPEQEEMRRGARNRLMRWGGVIVPYRPGSRGLVAATARAGSLLRAGALVAIAGEGRIHSGEGVVLPIRQGPAYLALRAGVPLVPVAVNGTSWLGFRRLVRVRIGDAVGAPGSGPARPIPGAVAALTGQLQTALEALVRDFGDMPRPGRLGRLLTELFNDWPEGSRPPAGAQSAGGTPGARADR